MLRTCLDHITFDIQEIKTILVKLHGDTHYSMMAAMSLDGDRKCSNRSSSQLQTAHWAGDERKFCIN